MKNKYLVALGKEIQRLSDYDKECLGQQLAFCRHYGRYAPGEWYSSRKDEHFNTHRKIAISSICHACIGGTLMKSSDFLDPETDEATLNSGDKKHKRQLQIIRGIDAFVRAYREEIDLFYKIVNKQPLNKVIKKATSRIFGNKGKQEHTHE